MPNGRIRPRCHNRLIVNPRHGSDSARMRALQFLAVNDQDFGHVQTTHFDRDARHWLRYGPDVNIGIETSTCRKQAIGRPCQTTDLG